MHFPPRCLRVVLLHLSTFRGGGVEKNSWKSVQGRRDRDGIAGKVVQGGKQKRGCRFNRKLRCDGHKIVLMWNIRIGRWPIKETQARVEKLLPINRSHGGSGHPLSVHTS